MKIDPKHFPNKVPDELLGKGVYALCIGREVVYIGKSDICILQRMAQSVREREIGTSPLVEIYYLPCDGTAETEALEDLLIKAYKPPYNLNRKGK